MTFDPNSADASRRGQGGGAGAPASDQWPGRSSARWGGAPGAKVVHCLTVDVEEYFHAEAFSGRIAPDDWGRFEPRASACLERIGAMLERHRATATFFVLGWMVAGTARLLRSLLAAGHEVACHGDGHAHLSRMTPATLREDLRRARGRIEDVLGVRPAGYRAPTFSVTPRTAWALDVIVEQGFEYDASIFPIRHDRYGFRHAPAQPFWAVAPCGVRILELPPLTVEWGGLRLPVGGGGYLRLLPGVILRRCVAREERRGRSALLYVHPWELDADQPKVRAGPLTTWRHRVNLRTTEAKLERLLSTFAFGTARSLAQRVRDDPRLTTFDVVETARGRAGARADGPGVVIPEGRTAGTRAGPAA